MSVTVVTNVTERDECVTRGTIPSSVDELMYVVVEIPSWDVVSEPSSLDLDVSSVVKVPGTELADVLRSPVTESEKLSVFLFEDWAVWMEVSGVFDVCALLIEDLKGLLWLEGASLPLDMDTCDVPLIALGLVTIEVA